MSLLPWIRVRFKTVGGDRPVRFPPPGPYWVTPQDDFYLVETFVKRLSQIEDYWPEAHAIELIGAFADIEFTHEFPKPQWWNGPRK